MRYFPSEMVFLSLALLFGVACDEEEKRHFCATDLAVGSGYPSMCDPEIGCPDGQLCGAISPTHDFGVCTVSCEDDGDCATDFGCTGEGRCILFLEETAPDTKLCAYTCEAEADCPPEMTCTGYSGLRLCYPVPEDR